MADPRASAIENTRRLGRGGAGGRRRNRCRRAFRYKRHYQGYRHFEHNRAQLNFRPLHKLPRWFGFAACGPPGAGKVRANCPAGRAGCGEGERGAGGGRGGRGAGSGERGAGSGERGAGSGERGAGCGERGAGSRVRGASRGGGFQPPRLSRLIGGDRFGGWQAVRRAGCRAHCLAAAVAGSRGTSPVVAAAKQWHDRFRGRIWSVATTRRNFRGSERRHCRFRGCVLSVASAASGV